MRAPLAGFQFLARFVETSDNDHEDDGKELGHVNRRLASCVDF